MIGMGPILLILLTLTVLSGLVYIFLIWNFNYWTKRGLKSVKSYPFVGSFPSQFTKKRNVVYDVHDFYREYKSTNHFVGVMACRMPQVLILSPDYVRKVLVSDFHSFHDNEFSILANKKSDVILSNNTFSLRGEEWKMRRSEITPGLKPNRINAVYPVTQEVCKRFVEYIERQQKMVTSHEGINAKNLCLCYTTEVVSDCVLGIKAESFTEKPTPILSMITRVFDQSFKSMLFRALGNLIPQIRKIYMAPLFDKEVQTFFFDLMQTSIDLRQKTQNKERVDFLNYMLQLQEKKQLSLLDLTSHSMTFLTDGFETTASVLAHTMLLLGRNFDAQERLRDEIGRANLTFEQLSQLPYLDACIHESLRIFPPQLLARKLCTEPYEMVNKDGKRVKLLPGHVAIIPSYSIHHDSEYYDDPEEFKPERFLENNDGGGGLRKYREMGVHLAFGDGPRTCPGIRFAMTQMKAALVEVLRNFNIKVNPKTRKDNYLHDTFFMAALHGGVWLDFERRSM